MPEPSAPVIASSRAENPAPRSGIAPARRGLWCASLLALGMLAAGALAGEPWFPLAQWLLCAALLSALAGAFVRGAAPRILLPLAVLLAGSGWFIARTAAAPRTDVSRFLGPQSAVVDIAGIVSSTPETRSRERGALGAHAWERGDDTLFLVDARWLTDTVGARTPVTGRVRVRVDGALALWTIGEPIRIHGMGRALAPPDNPGEKDWRSWSRAQGISGTAHADGPSALDHIELERTPVERLSWEIQRFVADARARARALFHSTTENPDDGSRALLAALVLGAREEGYDDVDASFRRLGLSHVLAISGLHVTLLAGALILLVRTTGDRPWIESLALALAVGLIILVVPARSPILRAAIIVIALRAGRLAGRRWDALNMLGWAMCAVIIWRPTELWNPGFQLSFGIVGALVWLTRPVCDQILGPPADPDHRTPAMRAFRGAVEMIVAGIIATLVSAPAIAAHFDTFSPAAPVLTILVLPLVFLATTLGYAAVAAELLLSGLGASIAPVALDAAGALLWLVRRLECIPGMWVNIGWVSPAWAACTTLLVLAWFRFGSRRSWALWLATLASNAWIASTIASRGPGSGAEFRIDSLAVGDGSAHLLRTGHSAVMFDCGSRWFGIGERTIPDAVRALRSPRVETVIISHHDTDHYSGLLDAAESLGVRRVLVTPQFLAGVAEDPSGPGAQTIAGLGAMGIGVSTISRGDRVDIGGDITLDILWPPHDYTSEKDNNTSVVALARIPTPAGERRVLLTGDIEHDAISRLTALEPGLRADILEAPHHGSARPFAIEFVTRLDPRIVLQSSGPSRSGDARWDRAKRGRTWLLTADVGCASAEIREDGSLRGWGFRDDRRSDDLHRPLDVE